MLDVGTPKNRNFQISTTSENNRGDLRALSSDERQEAATPLGDFSVACPQLSLHREQLSQQVGLHSPLQFPPSSLFLSLISLIPAGRMHQGSKDIKALKTYRLGGGGGGGGG